MTASVDRDPEQIGRQFERWVERWLPLWYEGDELRQQWETEHGRQREAAHRLAEIIGPGAQIFETNYQYCVYGPETLRIFVQSRDSVKIDSPLPLELVLSLLAKLREG